MDRLQAYIVTIIFVLGGAFWISSALFAAQPEFVHQAVNATTDSVLLSQENQDIIDHERRLVEQEALNSDFYTDAREQFLQAMPPCRTTGDMLALESVKRNELIANSEEEIKRAVDAFEQEAVRTPGGKAFIQAGLVRKAAREQKEEDEKRNDFYEAQNDDLQGVADAEADVRDQIKCSYDLLFEQEQIERSRIERNAQLKQQNSIVYGYPQNNPIVAVYEGDKKQIPLYVAQIVVEGLLAHAVIKNRRAFITKKMLENPELYIEKFAQFVDKPEVVVTKELEVISEDNNEKFEKTEKKLLGAQDKKKKIIKKEAPEKEGFFNKFTNLFSSKPKSQTLQGLVKVKGKKSEIKAQTKPIGTLKSEEESVAKIASLKAKKIAIKPNDQMSVKLSWKDKLNDFIYGKKSAEWEKKLEQKNPAAFARYQKNKAIIGQKKQELNKTKDLITWLNKEHQFITMKSPIRGSLVAPFALNCALRMALVKLEHAYLEDPRFKQEDRFGIPGSPGESLEGFTNLYAGSLSLISSGDHNILSNVKRLGTDGFEGACDSVCSLIAKKDERLAKLTHRIVLGPPKATSSFLGGMYNFLRGKMNISSIYSTYKTVQEKGLFEALFDTKEAALDFCTEMKMLYKAYEPEMRGNPQDRAEVAQLFEKNKQELEVYIQRLKNEDNFLKDECRKYTQLLQEQTPALWAFEKKSDSMYQVAGYDLEKIPHAESSWKRDIYGSLIKKEVVPEETRSFPCMLLPAEVTNQVRTMPFKLPPISSLYLFKTAKELAWVNFAGFANIDKLLPRFVFGEFFSPSMRGSLTHRLLGIPPAISHVMWSEPIQQLAQLGRSWLEVKEIDGVYHVHWLKFITSHKTVLVRLLRQLMAARQLVATEPILGPEAVQLAEKELHCFVNAGHKGPYSGLLSAYVGADKAMDRELGTIRVGAKLSAINTGLMIGAVALRSRALWLPGVTPEFLKPAFRKVGLL